MNNKPKYHLFKNAKYAFEGLIHVWKTESSFKLEILSGVIIIPAIILVDFELWQKMILLCTAFLVLIVELLNSAVENVVDLVTNDYAPLAKTAKDIGATAVLFSITLHIICWGVFLL
jgi:diacylglycerol kinase (ATP)